MTENACPRCHGTAVVGLTASLFDDGGGFPLKPRHCKGLVGGVGAPATIPWSACVGCGLVWSAVTAGMLRAVIQSTGDELARQHLDSCDHGPFRDLPDTDLAREIGAAIAEIDALMMLSDQLTAVRRYRELRGVSWDQTHREVGNWARLTREEKLALFGWSPKKKSEAVDPDFGEPLS